MQSRALWWGSQVLGALLLIAAPPGARAQAVAGGAGARACPGASGPGACIVSIGVSRKEIHRDSEPSTVTVIVTLRAYGPLPESATATVQVATYRSTPVRNNISYPPPRIVHLVPGTTRVKFSARATAATVTGTVDIFAEVSGPSSGVRVYDSQMGDHLVRLRTLDP